MENPVGLVGQTIGKYRVVEHLGRGGMAEVYKAYQPNLDRYVALKLMHAFLAGDQDFISRFEREAKNVAALRHPNIVQVYDFDVHNSTPFMVMEYIEGGTLKTHLENLAREGKALPLSEATRIIHEVGEALSYAHKRSMIHRDVKPANVLLDTGGRVILTDFGIAKILTGPSYTVTGATIGTPAYMSPEQGLGRPGDHRSDIYALGVMLYQLATGQLPFEADTPLAVMLKHVNDPMPLPRTFKPDLPEGIERIILKAMAKNPDDRFQSADEMLAQLGDLDSATLLSIPPASMAAGAEAHAPTMAKPPEPPPGATMVARPDVTRAASLGAGAAATQLHRPATEPQAPVVTPAPPARRPMPMFAVVGVVAFMLLALGGGAFAFTGGFGLLRQPAPSATPSIAPTNAPTHTLPPPTATIQAGTSTPNSVETQLAELLETQDAIAAAVATATASATPDLTATFSACTFDYSVTGQQPAPDRALVVGAKISVVLTVSNTGTCAFPEGTVLSETVPSPDLPGIVLPVPAVAPQESAELGFDWPSPRRAGEMVRVFELRGPADLVIGEPLTLTYRYVPPPTQRPQFTATFTPVPATATPAVSPLTDIYPQPLSCAYHGDLDYRCTIRVHPSGGTGPYTLWYQGQRVGFFHAGQPMDFQLVWRRCNVAPYNLLVRDDGTSSEVSRDFAFDPAANSALFPGGACTLP